MCSSPKRLAGMRRGASPSFTLVEMMVALVAVAALAILLTRVVGTAAQSTKGSKNMADDFTKARSVLDLFAGDVKAGLFRPDLAAFEDANGSNAICFYTLRPAVGGARNLSLVSYQLDTTNAVLERNSLPVQWTSAASVLSFNNTNSLPADTGLSSQNVAMGILRVRTYFIDNAGNLNQTYSSTSRAVGMTLVAVDAETLGLLNPSQLAQLTSSQGAFPDDSRLQPPETLQTFWEEKENTSGFFNGYPASLRSGLRIFERYVALPQN